MQSYTSVILCVLLRDCFRCSEEAISGYLHTLKLLVLASLQASCILVVHACNSSCLQEYFTDSVMNIQQQIFFPLINNLSAQSSTFLGNLAHLYTLRIADDFVLHRLWVSKDWLGLTCLIHSLTACHNGKKTAIQRVRDFFYAREGTLYCLSWFHNLNQVQQRSAQYRG